MRIQGILNTPEEPEAARIGSVPPREVVRRKEKAEPPPPVIPPAQPPPDQSRLLERLAEEIRKYIRENRTSVDISVDEELQQIVTRVIDEDSGKVIRQYPEDAALAVMKHLKELRGFLVNRKG